MDYRLLYEHLTKKCVPQTFHIHHIDGNRGNNDIRNLVALPKDIHSEYHLCRSEIGAVDQSLILVLKSSLENGSAFNSFILDKYIKFVDCWGRCQKYLDYRNYLLGDFPFNEKLY